MPSVTISDVTYNVVLRRDGVIHVQHTNAQYSPMHGAGTEGVHSFDVHPCQSALHRFWMEQIPDKAKTRRPTSETAETPWWSLKSARVDNASRPLSLTPPRRRG